jgi:hypothetical protein
MGKVLSVAAISLVAGLGLGWLAAKVWALETADAGNLGSLSELRGSDFEGTRVDCEAALARDTSQVVDDTGPAKGTSACYLVAAGDPLDSTLIRVEQRVIDLTAGHNMVEPTCIPVGGGAAYPLVRNCPGGILVNTEPATVVVIDVWPVYPSDVLTNVGIAIADGGRGTDVPGSDPQGVARIVQIDVASPFASP